MTSGGLVAALLAMVMVAAVQVSGHYFGQGGMVARIPVFAPHRPTPVGGCGKIPFPGSKYRYLVRGHYGKFQFYDCRRGTQFDPRFCKCVPEGYGGPQGGSYGGTYIGFFPKPSKKDYGNYKGYGGSNKGYGDNYKGYGAGYNTDLAGGHAGYAGGYDPKGWTGFGQKQFSGGFGAPGQYGGDGGNFGVKKIGYGPYCNKVVEPGYPNRYRVYDKLGGFQVYTCEKTAVFAQRQCKCVQAGPVCYKKPVPGYINKFLAPDNNGRYQLFICNKGMHFLHHLCKCVYPGH